MAVVDFVIFSQLILDFEARLEKIYKQLEIFRFAVERGHRCQERFWQFENSVNIVTEICRNLSCVVFL